MPYAIRQKCSGNAKMYHTCRLAELKEAITLLVDIARVLRKRRNAKGMCVYLEICVILVSKMHMHMQ